MSLQCMDAAHTLLAALRPDSWESFTCLVIFTKINRTVFFKTKPLSPLEATNFFLVAQQSHYHTEIKLLNLPIKIYLLSPLESMGLSFASDLPGGGEGS